MLDVYKPLVNARYFDFLQPQMAQAVIDLAGVSDGAAISMTVNGRTVVFEFDNNSSVSAGRVRVPIGASSPDTAFNLQQAAAGVFSNVLRFVYDAGYVYVISNQLGTDFTGATVAGAATWTTLMSQRAIHPAATAFINRPVRAVDVARGNLAIFTSIDQIEFVSVVIRTSPTNLGIVLWDGTITINGDEVILAQGVTNVWSAGNIVQLVVMGDKRE